MSTGMKKGWTLKSAQDQNVDCHKRKRSLAHPVASMPGPDAQASSDEGAHGTGFCSSFIHPAAVGQAEVAPREKRPPVSHVTFCSPL